MFKIYTSLFALKIVNVQSGTKISRNKKDVTVYRNDQKSTFFFFETLQDGQFFSGDVSTFVDLNDVAFPSAGEFELWCDENIGNFNSAPGGSGVKIGTDVLGGSSNNLLKVNADGKLGQVDPAAMVIPTTGVGVSDVSSPTGQLAQTQKGVYDFAQSKAIFSQLIDDIDQNIRTVFNGVNTVGTVTTPLVISAIGDYFEFEVKCNVFAASQSGILGEVGTGNSSIGISGTLGRLRMRSSSGAWFASVNILNNDFTTSERFIVRIENVAGVWKSYKNGVFQKDLTEGGNSFTLAAFGNAFNSTDRFNGELSRIKGKAQGIDFDFGGLVNSPLVTISNAVADMSGDGFLNPTQVSILADTLVDYAPCFYEIIYNTGGTVFESVMVYMKIKAKNKYMGIKIERRINVPTKQDVYKILNAFEYTYSPSTNAMILNGSIRFIEDGESEFVYKIFGAGGGQFTGGGHGYETFNKILFYAGGNPIAITAPKSLTRCEKFEYIQMSTTWNVLAPTQADGTHIKTTRFIPSEKKIETRNIMTWSRTITLDMWYHGIFCLGKGVATKVRNEFFDEIDTPSLAVEQNPAFQSTRAFELVGNNTATGYSGRVKSTIKRPLLMAQSTTSDMFIAIRLNDTKFYNKVTGAVVNGDVWENVQESFFETI